MELLDRIRHYRRTKHAAALRRAGDPAGAVDAVAPVLVADPDNVHANAEMARALRLLGDPAGAEEHLRTALAAVLDYHLTVELAEAVAEQGRGAEATVLLDGALSMADGAPRLDPGEALVVRAAIEHATGDDAAARASLDAIPRKRASRQTAALAERLRARLDPGE
ncbi:MAG TPA: tetratricopeptide repeat protein [Actinomycetota bacterium]